MESEDAPKDGRTYGVRYGAWVALDKFEIGLDKVDNESDANKPISNPTAFSLSRKEPTIAAGAVGQYWRGDKTWQALNKTAVGLNKVDNTPDKDKKVESALIAQYVTDGAKAGSVIIFSVDDDGSQPDFLWGGKHSEGRIYETLRIRVGQANNADNANAIGGIESADLFALINDLRARLEAIENK